MPNVEFMSWYHCYAENQQFMLISDLHDPCTLLFATLNSNINPLPGTYYAAVVENRADFNGRIVVDVGAGSGILSLFAAQVRFILFDFRNAKINWPVWSPSLPMSQ